MRLRLGLVLLTLLAALAVALSVPQESHQQGTLSSDRRTHAPDRHGQPRQTSDGEPGEIAGAMRRAFAASTPYLINVITDVAAEYPRTTTGV